MKYIFNFFYILTKKLFLKKIINYLPLYEKTVFKSDFGPREVPQPENV